MFACTHLNDKNRSSPSILVHGVAVIVALILIRHSSAQTVTRAAEEYTVTFTASFQASDSAVELKIVSGVETHRLLFSPKRLIWRRSGSVTRRFKIRVSLNTPHLMILQCRRSQLAIILDNKRVATRDRKEGACRFGFQKVHGTEISKFRFQPVAPVRFSDDFMRTEEAGQSFWRAVTGSWSLAPARDVDFAASPFRFQARTGTEVALAKTGHSFWRDYFIQVSTRMASSDASAGVAFAFTVDESYFLFRWNSQSARFELLRQEKKESLCLVSREGHLEPGQWYRFGVAMCGAQARCFVDETEIFRTSSDRLTQGRVGLYAEPRGGPVDFDDVEVTGLPYAPKEFKKIRTEELIEWMRSLRPEEEIFNPNFQKDKYMQVWAGPTASWIKEEKSKTPGYRHLGRFYRGFEMSFPITVLFSGELEQIRLPGAVLSGKKSQDGLELRLGLAKGAVTRQVKATEGQYLFIRWTPAKIRISVDNVALQEAGRQREEKALLVEETPRGVSPELSIVGEPGKDSWQSIRVRNLGRYAYTFYRAPIDWQPDAGVWRASSRWSCRPEFTFFGGTSEHLALLWNKRSFIGDVALDAYAAHPMINNRPPYYADLSMNFTICGDGKNPFSGYTVMMGGWNRPKTQLYRKERIVAETDQFLVPAAWGQIHRNWFYFQLCREGDKVLFRYQGRTILEYRDPDPLKGSRVGFWALESGISIARAQIFYEQEGQMDSGLRLSGKVRRGSVSSVSMTPKPSSHGWTELDGNNGAAIETYEKAGKLHVRLTNKSAGGTFAASPPGAPFDVCKTPVLSFSYRLGEGVKSNFYLRVRDDWFLLRFTGPFRSRRPAYPLGIIQSVSDMKWHKVEIDLLAAFRSFFPSAGEIRVDEIRTGLLDTPDFLGAGIGGNRKGASWEVADFSLLPGKVTHPPVQVPRIGNPRYDESGTAPLAMHDDFEGRLDQWETFGGDEGAYLFRDTQTFAQGKASLMLYKKTHGGIFAARWKVIPFHLEAAPVLRFSYRMPPEVRTGLLLKVGEKWCSIVLSVKAARASQSSHQIQRDDKWHSTQINLLESVRQQWPDLEDLWVTEFLFADQGERVLNGSNQNKKGNRFWLDDVQLVPSGNDLGLPPVPLDGFPDRPFVSVIFPDRLFHHSFETGPMPWFDWLQGSVDFAPFGATGNKCARVFAFVPDPYLATMIRKGWIDVQRYPVISFDYRFPPEAAIGLLVNLGESYSILPLTRKVSSKNSRRERRDTYVTPQVPGCIADNKWRTMRIHLLDLLRKRYPDRKSFRVRTLHTQRVAGRNPLGTSCYFDNFSAHSQRAGRVKFVWRLPQGTTAISYSLDTKPDTVPRPEPTRKICTSAEYDLAAGDYYFHLRTCNKDKWSEPLHIPVHLK